MEYFSEFRVYSKYDEWLYIISSSQIDKSKFHDMKKSPSLIKFQIYLIYSPMIEIYQNVTMYKFLNK